MDKGKFHDKSNQQPVRRRFKFSQCQSGKINSRHQNATTSCQRKLNYQWDSVAELSTQPGQQASGHSAKNIIATLLRPSLRSFITPSLWGCNVTYMLHIRMHACTRTQTQGVLRDLCNQMRQKKSTGIQLEGGEKRKRQN